MTKVDVDLEVRHAWFGEAVPLCTYYEARAHHATRLRTINTRHIRYARTANCLFCIARM